MSTRVEILKQLADGKYHSGEALGVRLGFSRAAIHKHIEQLARLGVEIERKGGLGYRWRQPTPPLEVDRIIGALPEDCKKQIASIEVHETISSTSAYLKKQIPSISDNALHVCLAETQSAGQGRRGRAWQATPYQNILFSCAWCSEQGLAPLSGLSLVAGLALIEALHSDISAGLGLKWPNDLLYDDRKLAGILLDVSGESMGPSTVVLGMGINVYLDQRTRRSIDQSCIDMHEITDTFVERNALVARLLERITHYRDQFMREGFEIFRKAWEKVHAYQDRPVQLSCGNRHVQGVAVGIDAHGSLLLRDAHGDTRAYHSGEISVARLVPQSNNTEKMANEFTD